jgi:hypothetical protein
LIIFLEGKMSNQGSTNDPSENSAIAQFLTPEAMLTPGVAGSLTMMITNALALNFAMPRAWVGLSLSFVFGLLVLVTSRSVLQKTVFYILNSLVIFCVAAGANGLGAGSAPRVSLSLITSSFAAEISSQNQKTLEYCSNLSSVVEAAQKANQAPDKIVELVKPCQEVTKDLAKGINGQSDLAKPTDTVAKTTGNFFSPWKF